MFDEDFNDFSESIVAPLWSDYISGTVFYRSTVNSSILSHITEMITDISSNYSNYQPTLAVITTWDSVVALSTRPTIFQTV